MFKKTDRRIGKTKNKLHNALMELTAKQSYESISIKDITTKANVGRSTFYSHFEHKDELLLSKQNEILKDARKNNNNRDIKLLITEVYVHLSHAKENLKAIANDKSGELMLDRLSTIIEDYFDYDTRRAIVPNEMKSFIARACSCSIIGLAKKWIEGDQKINKEILIEKSIRIYQLHKEVLSNNAI